MRAEEKKEKTKDERIAKLIKELADERAAISDA